MRFRELLLTPNKFSRPSPLPGEIQMGCVLAVVMHYTQAPGWSAEAVRNYFEGLKAGMEGKKSAHYAVDEDEAILMVPTSEVAYHCGSGSDYPIGYTQGAIDLFRAYPNAHAIGVEMCIGLDGELDPRTVDNARALATIACLRHDLNPMTQILRHYDVTGKHCPLSWVQHPAELDAFRESVKETMVRLHERGEAIA